MGHSHFHHHFVLKRHWRFSTKWWWKWEWRFSTELAFQFGGLARWWMWEGHHVSFAPRGGWVARIFRFIQLLGFFVSSSIFQKQRRCRGIQQTSVRFFRQAILAFEFRGDDHFVFGGFPVIFISQ